MANVKYYPEDVLVEKVQSGEYGWLDYINHHSPKWQEEYRDLLQKKRISLSMRNRQRNLSIGRASRLKLANNHTVQNQS